MVSRYAADLTFFKKSLPDNKEFKRMLNKGRKLRRWLKNLKVYKYSF